MNVKKENEKIFSLPILPMKNTALLPYLVMPLSVGRPRSVAAVEAALTSEDKEIVLLSQRDASTENPTQGDLYTYGTGFSVRCFISVDIGPVPRNGTCPVSISYMMQPSAY